MPPTALLCANSSVFQCTGASDSVDFAGAHCVLPIAPTIKECAPAEGKRKAFDGTTDCQ